MHELQKRWPQRVTAGFLTPQRHITHSIFAGMSPSLSPCAVPAIATAAPPALPPTPPSPPVLALAGLALAKGIR